MKNFYQYLAPFAPDYSGAVAVLYETRALIVLCDPGGCSGNVCGYDEPRFYENGGAIYSAALRDMDAIWGQDNKLVDKIAGAARFGHFDLIVLVGTPVVSVIATDLEAVCHIVEQRTGIRTISINTNGLEFYDRGEAKARKTLERLFPGKYELGPTPLDSFPDEATLSRISEEVRGLIAERGLASHSYDKADGMKNEQRSGESQRILIIHQPEAAEALRERLLADIEAANHQTANIEAVANHRTDDTDEIGDRSNTDTDEIGNRLITDTGKHGNKPVSDEENHGNIPVSDGENHANKPEIVTGGWFRGCDIRFDDEEEFIRECLDYDIVICDPLYERAIDSPSAQRMGGDYRPAIVSFPHLAVSGDLFMNKLSESII